jgi:alkanesulfonate monooxygenase SsuD/methylene tetrahydromethanopterin reductase-like flavin-dependent oxidoreductase (luciferase family)
MVGSIGAKMLATALPHVEAWNTWYDGYGNTPDGFVELNATVSAAAERAGRDPAAIRRSACLLVAPDGEDRAADDRPVEGPVHALRGGPSEVAAGLRQMANAGADEVIVVVSPITESSVRAVGAALERLET